MSNQNHLVKGTKPYQYYFFRCIIPKDLRSILGKFQIRISLKNSDYCNSKIIAKSLYIVSKNLFDELRLDPMKNITIEDVKDILRIEVRKSLLHIHHYQYGTNVFSKDKLSESISKTIKEEERLRDRLEKDYKDTLGVIEREIDKILITLDLDPNKESVEYKGLVRRWIELKLMRQDWKRDLLNDSGKTDEEFQNELETKWKLGLWKTGEDKKLNLSPVIENYSIEPIEPYIVQPKSIEQKYNKVKSSPSPLFSKVFPEFLENMKINKRRTGTIGASKDAINQLIEIIGDKPIGDYNNVDGREYRNALSKLPSNRTKNPKYRDKTLKEILSKDIPVKDRISQTTQKLINSKISGFFNYCLDEYPDYVGSNVFRKKYQQVSSVKLKDKKEYFTDEDLHLIFNPKTFLPYIFENQFSKIQYPYYWVVILGVFTGCRIEEICMMRVKDVIKENGVWVYKIREEGEYGEEETQVKNSYSERTLPLHPVQ